MTVLRTTQVLVAATLFFLMTRTYAAADPRPEYRLEVAPQLVTQALKEFAHQTKLQVVYYTEVAEGISSPGATGAMTLEDALKRLLAGTGLEYVLLNDRTVAIRQQGAANRKGDSRKTSGAYPWAEDLGVAGGGARNTTLLAQNSTPSDGSGESHSVPAAGQQELPRPEESGKAIPEMLVRGHRSINADIARTEDDTQPHVVFNREQIERSMAGNLESFLKTRLPMNTLQTANGQTVSQLGNLSSINLRGLGPEQTLILVDGRRMPNVSNSGTFGQPDINGIPLASIERIEVLPSTASGIYGGGATGGVVNIVTRKDYVGAEVSANYADVFEGSAGERHFDATAGLSLEQGRTHVLVSASYAESDPLLNGERDFVDRGRELQRANNPAGFTGLALPPTGATTNIRSQNGSNLVLDNGTALNSPFTSVPEGYAGPTSDGGVALVANAGRYNLALPNDYNGTHRSLVNSPTIRSVSLNVRRQFGRYIEAFIDGSWLENKGHVDTNAAATFVSLPANAPNNPFTTSIFATFPSPGLASAIDADYKTVRATGGVIARLPHDWSLAGDYIWSHTRFGRDTNIPVGDPDATGPRPGFNTALTNGALDVMRDVNAFPLEYEPYRLVPSDGAVTGPHRTSQKDATLRLSGPVFDLPGGAFRVSALAERREQEAEDAWSDQFNTATGVVTSSFLPARTQTVDSYYLETQVPLFSARNALPLLSVLELTASVRSDKYQVQSTNPGSFSGLASRDAPVPPYEEISTESRATKSTFGMRYAPSLDITLRASMGTGFMPVSIGDITAASSATSMASVIDPKRGGVRQTYTINASRLYNLDLQPEESESWSAGLILTPRFAPGLRLSVDYTHIEKTNEVVFFNNQRLVDTEDFLPPGRITRDPLTPADQALGYTAGVITGLDTSLLNMARTEVNAYDMQLDYSLEFDRVGEFQFYTVGTYQPDFQRQVSPIAPLDDSAGYGSGPLQWRANGGVTWIRGPWTVGWDVQYYDSYFVYSATATAATIASTTLNQGSAKIPSQTYHDLFVHFRFGDAAPPLREPLSNLELRLGIQNVFDKEPPILATTAAADAYSTYADPRLRRYGLTVRMSF